MTATMKAEYQRIRSNLLSLLSRAKRDGIEIDDLRAKVPAIPKKITEGSIRRIRKIHEEAKHEVAKRRRTKRRSMKYKAPEYVSDIALENIESMIEDAITDPQGAIRDYLREKYKGPGAYPNWEMCIVASGRAAEYLMRDALRIATRDAAKMKIKPDPRGTLTRLEWNAMKARELVKERAEEVLRTASEAMERFLYGYQMPPDMPKPEYYAILRAILADPLTPSEIYGLFQAEEETWGLDEYE